MKKYLIPIIIGVVVVALISVIIIVILMKKKKKSTGYSYEGDGKVIGVNAINEIDNKYRTDSVNLSTEYDESQFINNNTPNIEIEILEDNFKEDISNTVAENDSNAELLDSLDSLDDNHIAFGNDYDQMLDDQNLLCKQCGTNLVGAKGFCPGCGKPL